MSGGLDIQKQEIREAVELPLTHFQLYRQIGIDPPRGVLLYGPPVSIKKAKHMHDAASLRCLRVSHPCASNSLFLCCCCSFFQGTGKTMMAKAVAHHTTAAFIRVVGSEFVQKYLGEGPRMVRDVFRLARENAPAIIFIVRKATQRTRTYESITV